MKTFLNFVLLVVFALPTKGSYNNVGFFFLFLIVVFTLPTKGSYNAGRYPCWQDLVVLSFKSRTVTTFLLKQHPN